ncbi:hypothetical protein KGF56_001473 [Candida oxycetoniae]|uniref:Inositolphosphotransferase Aur1/Ipt1 domain-containing protein n=1 Tax=Candida oxycetoniae TaxID=497107 RepID=A0AAI9T0P2_9ASCO|nr:uncharacterized protein KGF56_001473 [Candida oxycetoniae]KAI3405865.1 hypothetical protein KGF56_001473 [Candida oxycetoniae]
MANMALKSVKRIVTPLVKISSIFNFCLFRLTSAILSERTVQEFGKEWFKNFAFVMGCILFTALVNYIPRPEHIFYKFLYRFDTYFFDVWKQPVGSITGLILTCLGSCILYHVHYRIDDGLKLPHHHHHHHHSNQIFKLKPLQISTVLTSRASGSVVSGCSGGGASGSAVGDCSGGGASGSVVGGCSGGWGGCGDELSSAISSRPSTSTTGSSTLSPLSDINNNYIIPDEEIFELSSKINVDYFGSQIVSGDKSTIQDYWRKMPAILLLLAWFILNIVYNFKHPVYKTKNIVAWVFHVPVHFIVPPVAGLWLYIWHAPGALQLLTLCLGFQNFALILTYLVFPNAPPSFIKLYGDNKVPTFDMIYSDGQASEDKKFSFLLHKAIYYATPHKFASFPSLHSAFASLICFFVCHYSRWSWFKLLSLVNVIGQWWAEIYLDHHWRIDSLVGLIYAIIIWTLVKDWYKSLAEIDLKFSKARASGDYVNGSTMGMRLFWGTRLQSFFDPLA